MANPEALAITMGLDIPDFDGTGHCGAGCGTMKPFHRVGNLPFQSGHLAQIGTTITHKVSSVLSDLLGQVFGPERGLGGRATIGVMALAGVACFDSGATVGIAD